MLGCRRSALISALAGCALLISSSEAQGLTTIGQATNAASSGCSPDTFLQTGVGSGTSYTVPADGVLTEWSYYDGNPPASGLKLKVGRQLGAGATIIGESAAPGVRVANTLSTYSTRIPVQAGDDIGIYTSGTGPCSIAAGTSETFAFVAGDLAVGSFSVFSSANSFEFPVKAFEEPDVDNDGFGDQSQDYCDTDATTQGPCHPGSVSFGSQMPGTVSSPQTISLGNTSALALAISSISASGDFLVTSDGCSGHSITQGGSCQLAVAFAPAAAGTRTGTLSITDVANGSPQTVALTGTGSSAGAPSSSAGAPSGQRAAARAKCKKKHSARARRKCRKKANLLPV